MTVFIGLTGGIATGKSTVSRMLVTKGAALIDADVVARQVVEPGQPALAQLAARFPDCIDPAGALDRAKLGQRIFANPADREALNAITHPRIREAVLQQSQALAEAKTPLVVYDAPLLIENQLQHGMNGVLLVMATRAVQRQRLMQRNSLSSPAADARIDSQLSLDEKAKVATWVIDNSGTLEQTQAQVDAVWPKLVGATTDKVPAT